MSKSTLLTAVLLLLPHGLERRAAGEILLAQITFNSGLEIGVAENPPSTISAVVQIQDGIGDFRPRATIRYEMGPGNLGTTIMPSEPLQSEFTDILERPAAFLYSSVGFSGNTGEGSLDNLLTNGWRFGPIVRSVPRLGPGLQGYHVGEITVTVDSFTSIDHPTNPDWYIHGGQHTIRIYGNMIPEPAMATLAAAALFALAADSRKVRRQTPARTGESTAPEKTRVTNR